MFMERSRYVNNCTFLFPCCVINVFVSCDMLQIVSNMSAYKTWSNVIWAYICFFLFLLWSLEENKVKYFSPTYPRGALFFTKGTPFLHIKVKVIVKFYLYWKSLSLFLLCMVMIFCVRFMQPQVMICNMAKWIFIRYIIVFFVSWRCCIVVLLVMGHGCFYKPLAPFVIGRPVLV